MDLLPLSCKIILVERINSESSDAYTDLDLMRSIAGIEFLNYIIQKT